MFGELAGKAWHFHLMTAVISLSCIRTSQMTYTYINQINRSPRVKQENQNRCIIACCLFKEIDHKKISSTKIAKMGDCNDSSSHGDLSLSSDSDGEYQVESGKTREPQARKMSKQLRYYYRKTAGRTK